MVVRLEHNLLHAPHDRIIFWCTDFNFSYDKSECNITLAYVSIKEKNSWKGVPKGYRTKSHSLFIQDAEITDSKARLNYDRVCINISYFWISRYKW